MRRKRKAGRSAQGGKDAIPVFAPVVSERDARALYCAAKHGEIALGPHKELMENALTLDGYHCLLTSSGTAALYLAIMGLQLPRPSRIAVPATTYVATANAILWAGHTPVICDVDRETWCLSPESLREAGHVDAILSVDLYGVPAHVLSESGESIVHDCCESFGSYADKIPTHLRGRAACLSFYGSKVITCGEGGALVTDDDRLYHFARRLCEQGHSGEYMHDMLAWNFRMSNLTAALLHSQWTQLSSLTGAKNRVRAWYHRHLSVEFEETMQKVCSGDAPTWWAHVICVENRDVARDKLLCAGIETRPVFSPLYAHPHLARYKSLDCPVAEELRRTGIVLPSGAGLTEAQVERVCKVVNKVARPVEK